MEETQCYGRALVLKEAKADELNSRKINNGDRRNEDKGRWGEGGRGGCGYTVATKILLVVAEGRWKCLKHCLPQHWKEATSAASTSSTVQDITDLMTGKTQYTG